MDLLIKPNFTELKYILNELLWEQSNSSKASILGVEEDVVLLSVALLSVVVVAVVLTFLYRSL